MSFEVVNLNQNQIVRNVISYTSSPFFIGTTELRDIAEGSSGSRTVPLGEFPLLTDDTIAYWNFNTSNTKTLDQTPNAYNLSETGTVPFSGSITDTNNTARLGTISQQSELSVNNVSISNVTFLNELNASLNTGGVSFQVWYLLTGADPLNPNYLWVDDIDNPAFYGLIQSPTEQLEIGWLEDGTQKVITTSTAALSGVFYFIAVNFVSGQVPEVWINGVQDVLSIEDTFNNTLIQSLVLGSGGSTVDQIGTCSDFMITNRLFAGLTVLSFREFLFNNNRISVLHSIECNHYTLTEGRANIQLGNATLSDILLGVSVIDGVNLAALPQLNNTFAIALYSFLSNLTKTDDSSSNGFDLIPLLNSDNTFVQEVVDTVGFSRTGLISNFSFQRGSPSGFTLTVGAVTEMDTALATTGLSIQMWGLVSELDFINFTYEIFRISGTFGTVLLSFDVGTGDDLVLTYLGGGSLTPTTVNIVDGNWHYLTITLRDGFVPVINIDGVDVALSGTTTTVLPTLGGIIDYFIHPFTTEAVEEFTDINLYAYIADHYITTDLILPLAEEIVLDPRLECSSGMTVGGNVLPSTDNTYDIGTEDLLWKDVYATNSTIQVSAAKYKSYIEPLPLGMDFLKQLEPKQYRLVKGGDGIHFGLLKEDVERVSQEPVVYTHRGLRYTELIPILVNGLKELYQQL